MHERAEYKEVNQEQNDRIEVVRSSFSKMFDVLDINCKNCRETSLAITKLEEAQMWAIKGISRESEDKKDE